MDASATPATSVTCTLFDLGRIAAAFGANFLDAAACDAFVLEHLHHGVASCPECGADLTGKRRATFQAFGRVHCACGKWFSATTGTALHKIKLDNRQIVLVAYLLAIGADNATIAAAAEIDPETARMWRLKFSALGTK